MPVNVFNNSSNNEDSSVDSKWVAKKRRVTKNRKEIKEDSGEDSQKNFVTEKNMAAHKN